MADLTIAVSEAVCAKTLEVVVANFGFDVSDQADFGAFRVGYDGRLFLKGGSLELRDDGTIRLRELDARWDKLDFSLAVKLPEISFGGGVVEVPLGSILLPGTGIFSGGKTVTFTVHLAPFVEHELSLVASPLIRHFDPATAVIGKHCQDLHTALDIDDTKPQWRIFCDPQTIDFDLFDFADTVGDLFEDAFTDALDAALPRGLLHDLILAGIGSIADLLRTLLDIPDDADRSGNVTGPYAVREGGVMGFHVGQGIGRYAVVIGHTAGGGSRTVLDSRGQLPAGDLFAVTLITPGTYRATNLTTQAAADHGGHARAGRALQPGAPDPGPGRRPRLRPGGGAHPGRPVHRAPRRDPRPLPRRAGAV